MGYAAALNNHIIELVKLLLGTAERSKALLGQLAGTLVLAVLQQLQDALLIGGEANDLPDQSANKLDTLSKMLKID